MSLKERLIDYLKYKEISQSAFEKEVGLSNGYVNNINKSISDKYLQKIILKFTDINPVWLRMGIGRMLKNEPQPTITNQDNFREMLCCMFEKGEIYSALVVQQKNELIHHLYKEIGRLEAKIEELEGKKTSVPG